MGTVRDLGLLMLAGAAYLTSTRATVVAERDDYDEE